MKVGAKELRTRTAEIIRAVQDGERVTITYRGREVAEIRPLGSRPPKAADRALTDVFGMWADHKDMEDPSTWVREGRGRHLNR